MFTEGCCSTPLEPATGACPKCGQTGEGVRNVTVKSLVGCKDVGDQDYFICTNSVCEVVYFQRARVFLKSDLRARVWFKESEEPLPICYCSNLARQQIVEAVKDGNSTIDAVRKATGATLTGRCLTENPTGRCCHKAFQEVIDSVLQQNSRS